MSRPMMILPKKEDSGRKRMAAYCRVSTSSDEQLHSYATQVEYYSRTLGADPGIEFVGIYADEGISGLSAKKRPQFMKMVDDCRTGKIDAIITKSVSRFGRNTVDTLVYTRELRALGIDVYFEKENIHSLSADGELMLTLMAAFAENESQTMSENIAWGKRKRFADGNVNSIGISNIYGFARDEDGNVVIREDEAVTIRRIFNEFLAGYNAQEIAQRLTADGVKTRLSGKGWQNATIISMLHNEKYCGDVLFQKGYSPGPLSNNRPNRGELPQYYLEDAIPAIIDKSLWRVTQLEFARRVEAYSVAPKESLPFKGRILCGICGRSVVQFYSRTKQSWRCATKISRLRKPDDVPHEDLSVPMGRPEAVFCRAWNLIVSKKQQYAPRLRKTAETDENELTRYHAAEMLRLIDAVGKITEFDYFLSVKTLSYMILQPGGKLTAVFLPGIRITI